MRIKHHITTGQRFGRLTVVEQSDVVRSGARLWKCVCDCGNIVLASRPNLGHGNTKSCGCLKGDTAILNLPNNFRHGQSKGRTPPTPTYQAWANMLNRCRQPNNHAFKNYGGRGISVCDRWHDFTNFLADMGERPSSDLSIDRIDNDGNYEPSNCRWATRSQQNSNKRYRI